MSSRIGLPEVRHVAKLAHLALSDDEAQLMQQQLDSILDSMAKLAELDTQGVEKTEHAIPMTCALRPDVPRVSLSHHEVMRAAPRSDAGAIAVPKVLEGE
jgi:aspartyl-tRNA(Asn)/glutamyl-tRNA(Gln) amidotransferase subunit C